jgi:prephenate dehydrogenase
MNMINAIVGAKGDMAKNLLVRLLSQLGEVVLADRDSSIEERKKVWESDVIWLSIPRDKIKEAIEGVHLRPDQLIIDICSIKRRVSEQIKATGAAHLSLHPLHGPNVLWNRQRWVVINAKATECNENAQKIIQFLRGRGISFIQCETEDQHDFMMGIVLSMPEMMTVAMDCLISLYAEKCGREKPGINEMMAWATPIFDLLFSAYLRGVTSSAPWLRKDLLLGAFGNLVGVSKETFEKMSKLTVPDLEELLSRQGNLIKEISPETMSNLNKRINEWYATSTLDAFHPPT